ncbi:Crp/Fnr family transcriptional regulator [Hyphomicrobium sp.]|uniref:Crp/Fnr family transcriptional regulator n=1 Tax=Hyphomicrobium sp. TaxID=82 RepID=UPI002BFCCD48|nr:Crp/Fnr family transcriptional regulator [Hyphomicrobium sp.]HRN89853.1 Crp/Fnr family transcriptional regulator [Hyphomicrobium sp.]HRQ25718.1 Crp/Fnr family transcriptional regulator [Hyphomicrobium sp.]
MSAKAPLLEMLGQTPLFGALEEADRKAVAQEMRETSFGNGQSIFARGDEGRDIYLVTTGRVRLSVLTAEGRELSFAHAEPGHVFGEIAVLDGGVRTADATAVTKVSAYTLSKGALTRLINERAIVREAVIRFLCRRVREADHQLEGIALYPIEVRLARFFLATARQKGDADPGAKVVIDLPISQSELALLIGASRPKVNAALALLEDGGAIARKDTRFTCDIDELEAISGS